MPVSEPKLLGAGEWGYFRDDYLNLDQCRVILPYTRFEPKVREAIDATGWNYEPFDVSASDDAYWKLLRVLWGDGKTFIIIEHDIVIRPGTLRQLAGCVSHWCCF